MQTELYYRIYTITDFFFATNRKKDNGKVVLPFSNAVNPLLSPPGRGGKGLFVTRVLTRDGGLKDVRAIIFQSIEFLLQADNELLVPEMPKNWG